jgi:hypothetical protein
MQAGGQASWTTFHWYAFPVAIHILPGHRRVFERETHIVRYEQVEIAIPVVVQEAAACAPSWLVVPKSRTFRDVRKGSIPVVAIKMVLTVIRTEDVLVSVVVVIADANA